MIKKFLKTILLIDILRALFVGIFCILKKPVTKKKHEIKNISEDLSLDFSKCIECKTCESICPSKCIKILPNKKFDFDKNQCAFCKLCEKNCPQKAIVFFQEDIK